MNERRMSAHWPDYFRYDCAVGTDRASPLVVALDDITLAQGDESLRAAYATMPEHWPVTLVRRALRALGFPEAALADAEALALYALRAELLAARGRLVSIEKLATVYLGPVDVARGTLGAARPLPAQGAERLVVADVPANAATVIVRTHAVAPRERIEAFRQAVAVLVPDGTTVRVVPPARTVSAEARGYGTAPGRLTERRI